MAVIEGDQQTSRDADRIRATGAPAVQINTGKGCHLDAHMVGKALSQLPLEGGGLLLIENVGNLVCPAAFDLGEAHKVVILSVTEGEDKPLKYPDMFHAADLLLLNKVDLLPHLDFDVERCDRLRASGPPRARGAARVGHAPARASTPGSTGCCAASPRRRPRATRTSTHCAAAWRSSRPSSPPGTDAPAVTELFAALARPAARESCRVVVRGVVQGVGFRPFVYRLAPELGLAGWVRNDGGGVTVEVDRRSRGAGGARRAACAAMRRRWRASTRSSARTCRGAPARRRRAGSR